MSIVVEPGGQPKKADGDDEIFHTAGQGIIDATRRYLRSEARMRLQNDVYQHDGQPLSATQIDVLETLLEGPVVMGDLAASLQLDRSTITKAVNPLVDRGLATRETIPENRRYVGLTITETGRTAIEHIIRSRTELMKRVLAPMAPERLALLLELMTEFMDLQEAAARSLDPEGSPSDAAP